MDTSPEVAAQAVALIQAGQSQRNVSAQLNLSRSAVRNVYRRYLETGAFVRRQGRPRSRVTTERQDRFIVTTSLRNRHLTSIEIQNQLRDFHGVSVSARTVRRRLKERDMVPHKPANGPKLTRAHRMARLHFAHTHLNWTPQRWSRILFTDECKIALHGNDGRKKVYRRKGERFAQCCFEERVAYGGGSWTVWGGISASSKTQLEVVTGPRLPTLNAQRYIRECLEPHVMPYADYVGPNFLFMHDNARAHTAGIVREYLRDENIPVMDWPAKSPDMNPIEHMWDELKRRVRARQPAAETMQELRTAIEQEWEMIPQNFIERLINSMPNRMRAVVDAHGGNTRY